MASFPPCLYPPEAGMKRSKGLGGGYQREGARTTAQVDGLAPSSILIVWVFFVLGAVINYTSEACHFPLVDG